MRKAIPVVAFAEDVAASGGYWLALAGDEIFVEETSLIGSIGVISAGFGLNELIKRLGIERRLYTAGTHKSLLDPFLPVDPADVERLTGLQQDIHRAFKEHVRRRRGGKIDARRRDPLQRRRADRAYGGRARADRRHRRIARGDARALRRQGQAAPDRRRAAPAVLGRGCRSAPREPLAAIADLADWIEARVLWGRFGL